MLKAVLIIDESGAKGYSKNQESNPGELGVMAGYLVPAQALEQVREIAQSFFKLEDPQGKQHITDLKETQQNQIRERIYNVFKYNKICWFYEAVSVQGFYESNNIETRGGTGEKELLHSELFKGIFSKAISRLRHDFEESEKKLNIHVITDRLDKPIIAKFKTTVKDYVNALTRQPMTYEFTNYNKDTKTVEKYSTSSVITAEDESIYFDSIDYDIKCEDTPITFIADILANSTLYYLKKKVADDPAINLNSKQAIENHPLSHLVYGTYDANQQAIGSYSDLVHRRMAE